MSLNLSLIDTIIIGAELGLGSVGKATFKARLVPRQDLVSPTGDIEITIMFHLHSMQTLYICDLFSGDYDSGM